MTIRGSLLGGVTAIVLSCCAAGTSHAQYPVIDVEALPRWVQQAADMAQTVQHLQQTVSQLEYTVMSLTNVPRDLVSRVVGLMDTGIRNPLGDIMGNLNVLQNGVGYGSCNGAADLLRMNQYGMSSGGDFMGAVLNGNAYRGAGLMACTNQMMEMTQRRLDMMPDLLSELQSCADVTCTTAINGRISYEQAMIQNQYHQSSLMNMRAQQQRWTTQDQISQMQRRDSEDWARVTGQGILGGGGAIGVPGGTPLIAGQPVAPSFGAFGG